MKLLGCSISFPSTVRLKTIVFLVVVRWSAKGHDIATKLNRQNNTPIAAIAKSNALPSMFTYLGFSKDSYRSLNKADQTYCSIITKIQYTIEKRSKDKILTISFDNWSFNNGIV